MKLALRRFEFYEAITRYEAVIHSLEEIVIWANSLYVQKIVIYLLYIHHLGPSFIIDGYTCSSLLTHHIDDNIQIRVSYYSRAWGMLMPCFDDSS